MGKEWLYWGSGSGSGRSTQGGTSGGGGERDSSSSTTRGCMSAVLQLFDFQPFQFTLHPQPTFKPDSFLPEEPTILKGVEAPRNSLELEEPFMEAASFSSSKKEEENLNIPIGIQIKTSRNTASSKARNTDDLSSECSSSPGTKTPSLVARLMGLDLLPDTNSSSSKDHSSCPPPKSHLYSHAHNLKQEFRSPQVLHSHPSSNRYFFVNDIITGTSSLPETPRISSGRMSDVDHHRLSLQINKENTGEGFEFSSYTTAKRARRRELRQEDENRSPGNYAGQIVKQVKESVGKRVGRDITNTVRIRDQRRDGHVLLLKQKTPSKVIADESSLSKQSTLTCSPRLRFLELKNKPVTASASKTQPSHFPKISSSPLSTSVDNHSQCVKVRSRTKLQVPLKEQQPTNVTMIHERKVSHKNSIKISKKIACERYKNPPLNKKEDSFVRSSTTNKANSSDKKCKKTPLSNQLLSTNVPTLFPSKKGTSPPVTKLSQQQVSDSLSWKSNTELSSCSSNLSQQKATQTLTVQDNSNGATSTVDGTEFQYISRILKRTGIDKDTPVSFTKWHSPSHPLDPLIFHHLELFHLSTVATTDSVLSQQCNRKLMFQLVDELLVEIFKPCVNLKPCVTQSPDNCQMHGSELIDTLCTRIRSFPLADCRVLEDIDALINKDLCRTQIQKWIAFEVEGEGIVSDIERDIVDTLVHETATLVLGGGGGNGGGGITV